MNHATDDNLMLIPSELAATRLLAISRMLDGVADGVEQAVTRGRWDYVFTTRVPVDVVHAAVLVSDLIDSIAYEIHKGRATLARCRTCDRIHVWTTGDGHDEVTS